MLADTWPTPPGGEAPSFLGLVGIAVVVRVLLSACDVPSVSLLPEITSDYDERTTLFRYRYLSGWLGGIVMMLLAYTVFMPGPDCADIARSSTSLHPSSPPISAATRRGDRRRDRS